MNRKHLVLIHVILVLILVVIVFAICFGSAKEKDSPVYQSPDVMPVLVAHGGGTAFGYRITNSLESLDEAYKNGFRYIELDLEVTSDNHVVLLHDWEATAERLLGRAGQKTLREFKAAETFANLTLIDVSQLVDWLEEHDDVRIITDIKTDESPDDNLKLLKLLQEEVPGAEHFFIPQSYTYDEFEKIKELGFNKVILTLYRMGLDENTVISFVKQHDVWAVTMPQNYLSGGFLTKLKNMDVYVYTHGVNDLSVYEQWYRYGLYGIYTDYLQPAHWTYTNDEADPFEVTIKEYKPAE